MANAREDRDRDRAPVVSSVRRRWPRTGRPVRREPPDHLEPHPLEIEPPDDSWEPPDPALGGPGQLAAAVLTALVLAVALIATAAALSWFFR